MRSVIDYIQSYLSSDQDAGRRGKLVLGDRLYSAGFWRALGRRDRDELAGAEDSGSHAGAIGADARRAAWLAPAHR